MSRVMQEDSATESSSPVTTAPVVPEVPPTDFEAVLRMARSEMVLAFRGFGLVPGLNVEETASGRLASWGVMEVQNASVGSLVAELAEAGWRLVDAHYRLVDGAQEIHLIYRQDGKSLISPKTAGRIDQVLHRYAASVTVTVGLTSDGRRIDRILMCDKVRKQGAKFRQVAYDSTRKKPYYVH